MSLFSDPMPDPSLNNKQGGQLSFNMVDFVRGCVHQAASERPSGNLGNEDTAFTMLSHYLARKDSGTAGLSSSVKEALQVLDMMKQCNLLSDLTGWDLSAPASRLAVAKDNKLIEISLKQKPNEPVAVFSASGKAANANLLELDTTYRVRLTDAGALLLARAITKDYAPVAELGRRSLEGYLAETAKEEGTDFDERMQRAMGESRFADVVNLQQEAKEARERRSAAGEAILKVLEVGEVNKELSQEMSRQEDLMRAANAALVEDINLDECTARQLLAIAHRSGLAVAVGEAALTDAIVKKTVDLRLKLCTLENSLGLGCALTGEDALLEIREQISGVQSAGEDELSAAVELLESCLQSYQRFGGEELN